MDNADFWVFLALTILNDIHGKPCVKDNWSTAPILNTPIFGNCMSRDRYLFLGSILHFSSSEHKNSEDKLWKLRSVWEMFNVNWLAEYNMSENVAVDETLVLWKGHHSLVRYIPSKADKWGFKLYSLAESDSGYVSQLLVDEGLRTRTQPAIAEYKDLQKPGACVMTLMKPILNRGHKLGIDNFYTDIVLALHLGANQTDLIGTVRKGCRAFPKRIIDKMWSDEQVGNIRVRYTPQFYTFNWRDKKNVIILSTISSSEMVESFNCANVSRLKPMAIHKYNSLMPGVDLSDQKRHGRKVARDRVKRWYRKMFWHAVDVSLINSFVMCYKYVPGLEKLTHADFRTDLVKQILMANGQTNALRREIPVNVVQSAHYDIKKYLSPKSCENCKKSNLRKRSNFYCVACNACLCIVGCFSEYHRIQ
jgi:RNase P protein component